MTRAAGARREPAYVEPVSRAWDAPRETIRTACGRVVTRELVNGVHRYQLWEPAIAGAKYSVTRLVSSAAWGLAHTRTFSGLLPDGVVERADVLTAHRLREAARACDIMRRTVVELTLREDGKAGGPSRPAGIKSGVYESCGDIILMGRPHTIAALAAAQKRGG